MFVAEGKVTAGTVLLAPVASFGVGFYRFNFSEGGMTTAAVLRTPVSFIIHPHTGNRANFPLGREGTFV